VCGVLKIVSVVSCLLLVHTGCNSDGQPSREAVLSEVAELESIDDKRLYLESILEQLQALQFEEESLLFSNADEATLKDFYKRKAAIQETNATKISAYFDNYGYPSRSELGQYAAFAPYAVIYYSDEAEPIDTAQFRYFYGAYTFGDIPEDMFLAYLLAYYRTIKSEDYREDPTLSAQESIYNVLDTLDIEY